MIDSILLSLLLAMPAVKTDLQCLASVIHHEARGEPIDGQVAVGDVVLNRVKSKHYPDSVCKVAFQKDQFSGLKYINYTKKDYFVATMVYTKMMESKFPGATHYHTTKVDPKWNKWSKLVYVGTIKNHTFYRYKDG
jgi:spore germination cell wall hydrolase CwlJ-like protein